jgi:hypothetical protein
MIVVRRDKFIDQGGISKTMDDIKPQQSTEQSPAQLTQLAPNPETSPTTRANTTPDAPEQKSYFAALLLAMFLLPFGASRAYMGSGTIWLKIAIATYIALFTIILTPVAGPVLLVLVVLGIIDVFRIYGMRNNLAQHSLSASPRDLQYSRVLFIIFVVGLALYALFVALMIALTAAGILTANEMFNSNTDSFNGTDYDYNSDFDSFR